MNQPNKRNQNPSSSNRTAILIVGVLLGLGVIALVILLGVAFRQGRQQQPAQVAATLPAPTPFIPTMFIPTSDCGSPTLMIGSSTFQIQNIQIASDGSVVVPADGSGIAYWVEGTDAVLIFMLSPTSENLALVSSLTAGSFAKATWSNCNSMTFSLSAPQPGTFGTTYIPDQTTAGISIFLQADATGGFVVGGELTEEQIVNVNTPVSGGAEVQAEISLLETSPSPDGATIRVGVSIFNYGQSAITLSMDHIALIQPDTMPLGLILSEPALPKEIAPGATETLYFTFPRPTSTTATLKIFTVEYEIEGY